MDAKFLASIACPLATEEQLSRSFPEDKTMKTDTAPKDADADLIAAAPELYEALTGILDEIKDCSDPKAFDEWYEPGREALAKARGETDE